MLELAGQAARTNNTKLINDWKNGLLVYKFALDEVNTKLEILNEEFQYIHNYNPIEHMKSRLKSPESIIAKLRRKDLEVTLDNAREHIHDIAGIRIICSFTTDIYKIMDLLSRQSDVQVLKVKDYIRSPKPNGYRSAHLLILIPVFLSDRVEQVPVEIQIRTVAMDFWASLEHKIYYKFDSEVPESITDQLKDSAELIDLLDKRMLAINEEVQDYKKDDPSILPIIIS
ncbi:GTP pyrophosphokinase family protein [Gorillibacterium sp. CAU 1737]|uniref:GTP pyrophosphokinase n=1 Tax=Gorillibacterium sp. CAU 1737 TaxID=3140362 RepID=UPI00326020A9